MLRVLTLATLFPNGRPADARRVRRAADARARRARRMSRSRWSRRSGCRSGRCRSIPIMRRCAALPRERDLEGPRPSTARATGSGRWSARAGTARRMADALLPRAARDPRRASRFDVIDAEFFWPDGPAAMRLARGAGRALLDQGARQRHSSLGRAARHRRADRRGRAARRPGCSRSARALKADMAALGMPAEQDPGPPYRHRPRPLPAGRPRRGQGGARRRRAAARHAPAR